MKLSPERAIEICDNTLQERKGFKPEVEYVPESYFFSLFTKNRLVSRYPNWALPNKEIDDKLEEIKRTAIELKNDNIQYVELSERCLTEFLNLYYKTDKFNPYVFVDY